MLHFERMLAFYEWIAGWSLPTRLVVAGVLLLLPLAAAEQDSSSNAWMFAAMPAGVVLLPLLFGAGDN